MNSWGSTPLVTPVHPRNASDLDSFSVIVYTTYGPMTPIGYVEVAVIAIVVGMITAYGVIVERASRALFWIVQLHFKCYVHKKVHGRIRFDGLTLSGSVLRV